MRRPACWLSLLLVACGSPAAVSTPPFEPPATPTPTPSALPPSDPPPATELPSPPASDTIGALQPIDDVSHYCESEDDCVLVGATCGAVMAANRTHAVEVQAHYDTLASISECGQMIVADPVEPTCTRNLCITQPAPDADARACSESADCEAVAETCHWIVASRTAPGWAAVEARAEAARTGPQPPCVTPPPPVLACRFGFCSRADSLVPQPETPRPRRAH